MEGQGLAPSPVARALLELARRGASGDVAVGGRRLRLRDGSVIDVEPREDDEPLAQFLVKAGRVSGDAVARARDDVGDDDEHALGAALVASKQISQRALEDTTRAMWLDRLARAMAAAEPGHPVSLEETDPDAGAPSQRVDLVTLVLDGLARLADDEDAGHIGERAALLFSLAESPYRALAARWCDAGDVSEPVTVAQLLQRTPGCARRLAALVRAGLGVLGDSVEDAARRSSLPPPRLPQVQLDPGQAPVPEAPTDLVPRISRLPAFVASIEDPLDAIERRIRALEDAEAPGPERAAAWKELARVWQSHYRSVAEAARAWREAAAADPRDGGALERAAVLCTAIGRMDLARAYAEAAVRSASDEERAGCLVALAVLQLRIGDGEAAVAALVQALREDPELVEAHEMLALAARDEGQTRAVAEHARLMAELILDRDPSRARAWLAWASHMAPDDRALPTLLSQALAADNYEEAAVVVLADAARRSTDPDSTRAWRFDAAERAEASGQSSLASELLLEAFDAEPFLEILYEPVVADLEAAGASWLRAVVLEEIALACAPEDRSSWLTRAGEAHLELPGQTDEAVDLFARALAEDPTATRPLELLRAQATSASDPSLLADSLERVLRTASAKDGHALAKLLAELATLAEERLGSAQRALWAWRKLTEHLPDPSATESHVTRLQEKVRVTEGVREMAEASLAEASDDERPQVARKLAAILREDPAQRERAAALYREALAADPDDVAMASALERILWILGDDDALIAHLRGRVSHAGSRTDHIRQLARLAALEHFRGHAEACIEATASLLDLAPHHDEGLTRLERCAIRTGGTDARIDALTRRAHHVDNPRQRARLLTRIARLAEGAGRTDDARSWAEQALATGAGDAEAALIRSRTIGSVDAKEAAEVLEALRRHMGDSPGLSAALADAARAAGDAQLEDDALRSWIHVSPRDPEPAWRRVELLLDDERGPRNTNLEPTHPDGEALRTAIEHALGCHRVEPEVLLRGLDAAIERCGATVGCTLALQAADRVAHAVPEVVDVALRASEHSRDPSHRIAALERVVAHALKSERAEPLRQLASLHRDAGDRGAESRTLLRILEVAPADPETLARLADVYAEGGDHDRLRAVMALRLASATDVDERRERLRDLAAAVVRAGDDRARAEEAVGELLDDAGDDPEALGAAAGALAAVGQPQKAVEILCDAADGRDDEDTGGLYERAVALAERQEDLPLALGTAVRGLRRVPGHAPLLLMFERLALVLGDVATGKQTYAELAERAMGRHGRRGLRYRAARWLERAGDPVAALEAYQEAFELGPSLGVIFTSIERLAEELSSYEPLARACLTMAERMPHAERRLELLLRGAEVLERELDRPAQAFDVLDEAWRQLGGTVLYDRLRELVGVLRERDAEAGRRAVETLAERLAERAEKSWDDEDRVTTLMQAATLWVEHAGEVDRAADLIDQTLGADDVPASTHADHLCALAEWLRDAGREDEALARVDAALGHVPLHERALALRSELSRRSREPESPPGPATKAPEAGADAASGPTPTADEPDEPPQTTSTADAPEPTPPSDEPDTADGTPAPTLEPTPAPDAEPHTADGTPAPTLEPTPAPDAEPHTADADPHTAADAGDERAPELAIPTLPDPASAATPTDEARLRQRTGTGDLDAAEGLARLLGERGARDREALDLLLWLLRRDPSRVSALRLLHQVAGRLGAEALADVTAEVLSMFDPSLPAPSPAALLATSGFLDASSGVRHDARAIASLTLLRLVWEGASPLYRKSLTDYGIVGSDRVPAFDPSPLGQAWSDAVRVLRVRGVDLYRRRNAGREVFLVATHPPSVIAGSAAGEEAEVTLRFRLGRALELARPEHLLLATLAEEEGSLLVEAVGAAFGPPSLASRASRDAVTLAANLWNTIPGRTQQQIRRLLEDDDALAPYDQLRGLVMSSAARSGAMVAGQVRASAEALLLDDPALEQASLDSEDAYRAACRRSPPLVGLLQFALSDTYLAARARATGR